MSGWPTSCRASVQRPAQASSSATAAAPPRTKPWPRARPCWAWPATWISILTWKGCSGSAPESCSARSVPIPTRFAPRLLRCWRIHVIQRQHRKSPEYLPPTMLPLDFKKYLLSVAWAREEDVSGAVDSSIEPDTGSTPHPACTTTSDRLGFRRAGRETGTDRLIHTRHKPARGGAEPSSCTATVPWREGCDTGMEDCEPWSAHQRPPTAPAHRCHNPPARPAPRSRRFQGLEPEESTGWLTAQAAAE